MSQPSNESIVRRYFEAHAAHDYDTVGQLRHRDWTTEWPQSGERVRGHENDRAIMDNWPGGPPRNEALRIVGSEDRYVVTPLNTIHHVVGSGEAWWGDGTAVYPDGSTWFIVGLLQLCDGKVLCETWYFSAPIEAPAWRARWVERMA